MTSSMEPSLRSCCCGCTLKTGTLIIGWWYLISEIVFLVLDLFGITIMAALQETYDNSTTMPISSNFSESAITQVAAKEAFDGFFSFIIEYISWDFILCAVQVILAIILLVGAFTGKVKLLKIWVWTEVILTGLSTCISFFDVFNFWYPVMIIELLFSIYFIMVVKSYATELMILNQENYKKLHAPGVVHPPFVIHGGKM